MRSNEMNYDNQNSQHSPQHISRIPQGYQSPSSYDPYQPKNQIRVPNHILQRRNEIEKMMIETGEMDRLEGYLRKKLIAVGWKEDLKNYCKDLIREKGIERVTVQFLMDELENRGKHMIPITIKEDMIGRVRKFLEETGKNRQI